MVGHRGIEPRNTCVSGRPLRPAGSWPAEGGGVDPLGVTLRGLSRPGAAPAAHLSGAESGGPGPHRLATASRFRNGARHPAGSLSMAEDGVLETHPRRATRFPGGDRTLAASSSMAESGELESHGVTRALVSSEARPPWPVHSPCPTRDSNSEPLPSEGSASTKLG